MRSPNLLTALSLILLSPVCLADDGPDNSVNEEKSSLAAEKKRPHSITRKDSIKIDGRTIEYEVKADSMKIELGEENAHVFYVAYKRLNGAKSIERPVIFAFNGGPGSSAVWLHIGMLGPKTLQLPGDGTEAPTPPVGVHDNAHSLLDTCDLVFIDPVSTGYSRAEDDKKANHFHGLDPDIESVGEFIRRWVTENDRWSSPKYLLGESYGGIRAAGLSNHLQSRHGMSLNGVVLLSAILDYTTVKFSSGQDQAQSIFLPAYAAVAHHHGLVKGDRDALVAKTKAFAFGEYATALIQGSDLAEEQATAIAAKLEKLSGISAGTWLKHKLRIRPPLFRAELLRASGKTLGRFDGRVAWASTDLGSDIAAYDPSYSLVLGAFSTALKDYLGREIGYKLEQPYEILTGKVHPWKWNGENRIVNVSDRLAAAMRDNPHLKVLVMSGHTDLATPPECVAYSLRHVDGVPDSLRGNITTTYYEGGHMFYLNAADLEKSRKDLLDFIGSK